MMVPVNDRDLASPEWHSRSVGPEPATPTGDLLGFDASSSQQQQQHHVINANHATVSITTSTPGAGVAPSIAGLGKIESHEKQSGRAQNNPRRKTVVVPTYSCSGGFDTKFNHSARHARPSHLHNLLTPDEYERELRTLNDQIRTARPKSVDLALLATGPLIVPLAVWGMRHGQQSKKKRRLIEQAAMDFNDRMGMDGRNVRMVWNRAKVVGGGESYLTIEEVEEKYLVDKKYD